VHDWAFQSLTATYPDGSSETTPIRWHEGPGQHSRAVPDLMLLARRRPSATVPGPSSTLDGSTTGAT
jgi:hypothetical protein